MKIRESAEDYLEAVLMFSQRQEFVRAADLCRHTGFSRPTVSQAVKELHADGYLDVDGANHITLTEKGLAIAERMGHETTEITLHYAHLFPNRQEEMARGLDAEGRCPR